jgi:hypothetical protein
LRAKERVGMTFERRIPRSWITSRLPLGTVALALAGAPMTQLAAGCTPDVLPISSTSQGIASQEEPCVLGTSTLGGCTLAGEGGSVDDAGTPGALDASATDSATDASPVFPEAAWEADGGSGDGGSDDASFIGSEP